MKTSQPAFSMIELVFVIVVLGILASIAIPRLSLTRSDAKSTAVLADIQVAMSAIQQKFFTQELDSSNLDGSFILATAGLSHTRWVATNTGIRLAKNNAIDLQNNCVLLDLKNNHLILKIDSSIQTPLCQKLLKAYPQIIDIPLETSSIRF